MHNILRWEDWNKDSLPGNREKYSSQERVVYLKVYQTLNNDIAAELHIILQIEWEVLSTYEYTINIDYQYRLVLFDIYQFDS